MEEFIKLEKADKEEQIVDLIHQGLSRNEIAKKVGISIVALHSCISDLRTKGVLPYYSFSKSDDAPAIKGFPTIKEQEFLDLYSEGLTSDEIAKAMNLTMGSVKVYLQRLRAKGFLPRKINIRVKSDKYKKNNTEIEKLVNEFLQENDELFINYPYTERTVINVDIEKVHEIVKLLGYRSKDVHLLERLYVERSLYEDAIALLYQYERNSKLSPQEVHKVQELKHGLRMQLLKKLKGSVPHYINDSDYLK